MRFKESNSKLIECYSVVGVYNRSLPQALRQAQKLAGNKGHVSSMPQLLAERSAVLDNNEDWLRYARLADWYVANSEENVGKTARGKPVVMVVHGGGLLTPESIERSYKCGLTSIHASRLINREAENLLEGKLPDKTRIPVYGFKEFKKGISGLPARYAVVLDFNEVKKTKSGHQPVGNLFENPLVIARCGGVEEARRYINKSKGYHAKGVYRTREMANWHPFAEVNPDEPQGSMLLLGSLLDDGNGLSGNYGLNGDGRFLVVRQTGSPLVVPTLEQVIRFSSFVPRSRRAKFRERVRTLYSRS